MTREEFNNLDIMEQIDFINNELNTYKSITKVCKINDLRRQTIQSWFENVGFFLDKETNQYTKVNNSTPVAKEPENKPIKKTSNTPRKTTNTNTQDDKIKVLEGQIKSLENDIKNIYKLLDNNKCTKVNNSTYTDIIHKDIEGLRGTETIVRTYKIYNDIDKRLQKHISNNKQYKKQDIINSILIDYLDKYNK